MNKHPVSDPSPPEKYYGSFGEKEWTGLSRDCPLELLYHVHMGLFRGYVHQGASVSEPGVAAGVFGKELISLAGHLIGSDISEEQLAINKSKMAELGLEDCIHDFQILDMIDLHGVSSDQFNTVICVGGGLNYAFDKEQAAVSRKFRFRFPDGHCSLQTGGMNADHK